MPRRAAAAVIEEPKPFTYSLLTPEEAQHKVRRAKPGVWVYLRVCHFAPSADQSNVPEGSTRGITLAEIIRVSKKKACKFIADAYRHREKYRVEVSESPNGDMIIIGRSL